VPLYDIVLADQTEAAALASSESPLSSFPGFTCKPIDHVKLALLFPILDVATFEDAINALEPVVFGSNDGPFVSLLPPRLLDAISSIDPSGLPDIARNWGSSEEFARDGIGARQAEDFLQSVVSLWQHARSERRSLFLWATP